MGSGKCFVVSGLVDVETTPQSVILYDPAGKRQIHVDLKDVQESAYPEHDFDDAAEGADLAVLCNVNFNRPLLKRASELGLAIATDVHVLRNPADEYNADFMAASDILFLSDEGLWEGPEAAARELMSRYAPLVIIIGMGAKGALLLEKGKRPIRTAASKTRAVESTIGAGDALFSAFLHFFSKGLAAERSLELAALFASWKIGEKGGASGFLGESELIDLDGRTPRGKG